MQGKNKNKKACELRKCCDTCGALITHKKHECNKWICVTRNDKKEIIHLCFIRLLKNESASINTYCTYSVISILRTVPNSTIRRMGMYLISYICNSSVPIARMYQIWSKIAYSAVSANTHCGTTQSEICGVVYANPDLG